MTELKTCCDCEARKPREDFYTQRRSKDGLQRRCKLCQKTFMAEWYRANEESVRNRTNAWKHSNPTRRRQYNAEYRRSHPEKSASGTLWYNAKNLKAIPKWANREAIDAIYKKAAELTRATGIVHHVDHIVPMRSNKVCGLHVEHNLRVLTRKENRAKSNKLWPDMPEVAHV